MSGNWGCEANCSSAGFFKYLPWYLQSVPSNSNFWDFLGLLGAIWVNKSILKILLFPLFSVIFLFTAVFQHCALGLQIYSNFSNSSSNLLVFMYLVFFFFSWMLGCWVLRGEEMEMSWVHQLKTTNLVIRFWGIDSHYCKNCQHLFLNRIQCIN